MHKEVKTMTESCFKEEKVWYSNESNWPDYYMGYLVIVACVCRDTNDGGQG